MFCITVVSDADQGNKYIVHLAVFSSWNKQCMGQLTGKAFPKSFLHTNVYLFTIVLASGFNMSYLFVEYQYFLYIRVDQRGSQTIISVKIRSFDKYHTAIPLVWKG